MTAISGTVNNLCLDISKLIAEYSLGWIKLCPDCVIGEVLIIPSFIMDVDYNKKVEMKLKCSDDHCTHNCYIHICDECPFIPGKVLSDYFSIGWWLYAEPMSQTKYIEQPMNASCRTCVKFDGKSEELCIQCTYLCSGCGNRYCNSRHLAYHCNDCDRNLCEHCFVWMMNYPRDEAYQANIIISKRNHCIKQQTLKSCINCFYKLDTIDYVSNNNITTNFKDNYQFYKDVEALKNVSILSDTIYICVLIAEYSYCGVFTPCQTDGCESFINAMYSECNYFVTSSFNCDGEHHTNHIHFCDICKYKYWVNNIPSYYTYQYSNNIPSNNYTYPVSLSLHPSANWTSSVYDSRRPNICNSHMLDSGRIVKVCSDCSWKCNECDEIFCVSGHFYRKCPQCNLKICFDCRVSHLSKHYNE